MPVMQKGVAAFSDHLPKVISPTAHAIADYVALGGFIVGAALLWNRHRRAAIASLACAGGEVANILLTDFPGGVTDVVSFPTHARIDMGLAAATSALPSFLGFADEPEAKFFRAIGLGITVAGAITDFRPRRRRPFIRKSA